MTKCCQRPRDPPPRILNALDRKGRIERPFAYVENNFLAARDVADFDDLNRQALAWCRDVANHKPKQALGMSPEAAYVIERPHLRPLPNVLPPVYELLERVVDLHGYVSVDTNRYSVAERYVGQSVAVYKLPAEIHVCRKDTTIAVHRRLVGQRDARSILPLLWTTWTIRDDVAKRRRQTEHQQIATDSGWRSHLNGYRGRFYNAQVLLDELYASLADRTTTRLLAQDEPHASVGN
jgi:hypothetical protein